MQKVRGADGQAGAGMAAARPSIAAGSTARLAGALAVILGAAAACWVIAIQRMSGMDMGVGARLGSFGSFTVVWVVMMAAMMLPGAAPAAVRRARASGRFLAAPLFAASYLAVWVAAGLAVYALDRPHGTVAVGVAAIAAGGYELTPAKRRCRRMCQGTVRSGWGFGLSCAGSSAGLMLLQVTAGVMSVAWMAGIGCLVAAQKLLPSKAAIDVPVALALTGVGIVVLIAPSAIPGLLSATTPMRPM
jgi:predicted metal-binding membrane protein